MKGELGSTSRKGFEVRLGYGSRSKGQGGSTGTGRGGDAAHGENECPNKQSCWDNLPPELLRDVILRVEAAENTWPPRKHVISCAGVCRSWRKITKEIVKTPELSGKLTFPISLKQPGPRDTMVQCYIKRDRVGHTYRLYLGLTQTLAESGKFLLAARRVRRPTYTDYLISLDAGDMSKGSGTYIGKLRLYCWRELYVGFIYENGSFVIAHIKLLGTKFTVYDAQPPHAGDVVTKSRSTRLVGLKQVSPRVPVGNYTVAHISYGLNVLGARGPRRMHCVMDAIPATAIEPGGVAPTQTEFQLNGPLSSQNSAKVGMLILKNKAPRWHEQLQCWCLNFRGRVTVASVKNFQLVASFENTQVTHEHDKVLLQFGKVAKDSFTMDYRYPLSAFQGFAICLSSFDTKIACE